MCDPCAQKLSFAAGEGDNELLMNAVPHKVGLKCVLSIFAYSVRTQRFNLIISKIFSEGLESLKDCKAVGLDFYGVHRTHRDLSSSNLKKSIAPPFDGTGSGPAISECRRPRMPE